MPLARNAWRSAVICSLERRGLRLGMCIRETYTRQASSIDGHRRTDTLLLPAGLVRIATTGGATTGLNAYLMGMG